MGWTCFERIDVGCSFTKGFSNYFQKFCHACMIWTPFVSTALKQISKYLGIDLRQHCAYRSSSGGAVEKEYGTRNNNLAKFYEETWLYFISMFANEAIGGFKYLSSNDKSHRLTLLKHEMAIDYILAKTGGLCATLNLTKDACVTVIPDNSDNLTSVIDSLEKIRDAFNPSDSTGFAFNRWLVDKLGPWGAMLVQLLIPVLLTFGIRLCFCSCTLTCMKALMYRWIGDTVTGHVGAYMQLSRDDLANESPDLFPLPDWFLPQLLIIIKNVMMLYWMFSRLLSVLTPSLRLIPVFMTMEVCFALQC